MTRARLLAPALAAAAAASAACLSSTTGPSDATALRGTLWVANRSSDDVAVYAAADGGLLGLIKVGRTPIGVTAPPGTGKVYVSDEGSNTVSVIDRGSLQRVAVVPTGSRPHHMAHSPDGRRVYAALFGTNKVAVIETASDTLLAEWTSGPPRALTHAPWVTPDGRRLLLTNSGADEVWVLDALTGARQWSLHVGANPSEFMPSLDGRLGYVSARNQHLLQVVDLANPAVLGEVFVGTEPDTLQMTPDGQRIVIGLRGTPARVAVVDLARGMQVDWVDLPGTTTGHNVQSRDGRVAFVALEGPTPGVAVIDVERRAMSALYPYPGGGRPHGLALVDDAAPAH